MSVLARAKSKEEEEDGSETIFDHRVRDDDQDAENESNL